MRWKYVRVALLLIAGASACASDNSAIMPESWTAGDTTHVRISRVIPREEVRSVVVEKIIEGESGDSISFAFPRKLRLSGDGSFLVADGVEYGRALIFSADGSKVQQLGRIGSGPEEYEGVQGGVAALSNGDWAVFDTSNDRITVYDHDGKFKRSWSYHTNNIMVGEMLVADADGGVRIRHGVVRDSVKHAEAVTAYVKPPDDSSSKDTLFVPTFGVRPRMFSVTRTIEGGTSTTTRYDRYSANEELAWHPAGFPVVLETSEYKLALRKNDGKPLVVHRMAEPIKLHPEERKMNEDEILAAMKSIDANWTWPDGSSPATKPAAGFLRVMRDGTIWVAVNMPSERVTRTDTAGVERVAFRSPFEFEVFSPNGELVGRVNVPPKYSPQDSDGKSLWAFEYTDNDVVRLVKLRVEPPLR